MIPSINKLGNTLPTDQTPINNGDATNSINKVSSSVLDQFNHLCSNIRIQQFKLSQGIVPRYFRSQINNYANATNVLKNKQYPIEKINIEFQSMIAEMEKTITVLYEAETVITNADDIDQKYQLKKLYEKLNNPIYKDLDRSIFPKIEEINISQSEVIEALTMSNEAIEKQLAGRRELVAIVTRILTFVEKNDKIGQ